ncbi:MAG: Asp-tRNA(Asn)/Glu-tRNA(Gln) amidotransferase subunit GatB [Oligoflexia bacterium]|nr:Asp-tRNA(Asn)/Glu-tRNA(Gln) amidotransferase subunit GatB [Oligoflexia bacterium]
MDYETIVGLEVHAQLLTNTKLFCACSTEFGVGDNENTCPICTAMPGALPVLNKRVVDFAILTGLALNCKIRSHNVFARKNYFYPDLPKGYQISQFEDPICVGGKLSFLNEGKEETIGITRIHMEEDAGKSTHHGTFSLINLNRSSVPLLEIVSEPDFRSPKQAAEYMRYLRSVLLYLGVCDGNMEEGNLRCDANVSVRKKGETKFGTRVEIKNINSFRFVEKAIEYEAGRQIDLIESGQKVSQETRLYDPDKNRTISMRSKEEAHDYRYFPDPDLLPISVDNQWVEKIKNMLPELPLEKLKRFMKEYNLPQYDSEILTDKKEMALYFEEVAKNSKNPKAASNWIMGDLLRILNEQKKDITQAPITARQLADLILNIDSAKISGKIAKTLFDELATGKHAGLSIDEIISKNNLAQVTDTKAIEVVIDKIMTANSGQVEQYRAGKEKVFGFFVGQVMKEMKGQGNPQIVNDLLKKKLKGGE